MFVDLDGDGRTEMLLGTDDGDVHAYHSDMTELPGFPVRAPLSPWWPANSTTAVADAVPVHRAGITIGGPAVGDVDGDGDVEIVATDLDGGVSVWDHSGALVASMHVNPAYSQDDVTAQDEFNRTKPSFASAPALGDLDGDGDLEIVAAANDRHLYAWQGDGSSVAGFPLVLIDPAKVTSIDPTTHKVTFGPGSGVREGGELIATPALADLTGDGRVEIVVGAQEEYVEPPNVGDGAVVLGLLGLTGTGGNSRLYAVSPEATVLPGWPARIALIQTELLPTIGNGIAMPAAIGDVNPTHPGLEIMAGSAAGPLYVLDALAKGVYGAGPTGADVPLFWTAGVGLEDAGMFGPNRNSNDLVASMLGFGGPSFGDVNADGVSDVVAPTAGLTRLIDLLVPDLQLPSDDQMSMWDGATRLPLSGSPQAVSDLAFFVAPAVADLDGDGQSESIAGSSTYTISAFDGAGNAPSGWPKLTGGWAVGTPAVGDWDGDGTLEVALPRRDGVVLVWHATGTEAASWAAWGCDQFHSGSCATAVVEPPPPTTTTTGPPPPPTTTDAPTSDVAAEEEQSTTGTLPVTGRDIVALVLIALACLLMGLSLRVLASRTTAER
jgi:hypothetical protein